MDETMFPAAQELSGPAEAAQAPYIQPPEPAEAQAAPAPAEAVPAEAPAGPVNPAPEEPAEDTAPDLPEEDTVAETAASEALAEGTAEEAAQETERTAAEAESAAPQGPAPALSAASRSLPRKAAAPAEPEKPAAVTVIDVRFQTGSRVYYFDPGSHVIPAGAHVILETSRGVEFATCAAGNHLVPAEDIVQPLRPVLRVATLQDERIVADNREKEAQAYDICREKIQAHGLDMKLISVEYAFDGSKILFYFTADGRVDFRDLVRDLASAFRTRIELRQIGVRDEAKMLGGLGICGRPFCCAQFLSDFQPVSIKMAKTQNLSLNPTKISGACGRLMCCLKYEQEAYEDLIKTSPRAESLVDTPDGRGTITDVNLLRQQVTVRMEADPTTTKCYSNCDICVLRSGRARKNDPPIPDDLAPISSRPKEAEPAPAEEAPLPEPMLIRPNGEKEPAAAPAAEAAASHTGQSRHRSGQNRQRSSSRNQNRGDRQNRPKQEQAERQERTDRQAAEPHAAQDRQENTTRSGGQHRNRHRSRQQHGSSRNRQDPEQN